jgi:hypothetical protein
MIRGSGPRPDPELFAFCISMSFLMDPDPRIRVRVPSNSFRKIFTVIFFKENGSAPPFSGSGHVFYNFKFVKRVRYVV